MILGRCFDSEHVLLVTVYVAVWIRQPNRSPVFGNGYIKVQEVIAIKDDVLSIDFGPADSQSMTK
jgi:hypothetical protein